MGNGFICYGGWAARRVGIDERVNKWADCGARLVRKCGLSLRGTEAPTERFLSWEAK